MKRWGYLLTFVSGAGLAIVLGLTISATFRVSSVTAQQTAGSQKWEYCAVKHQFHANSDTFGRTTAKVPVVYLTDRGRREELVEVRTEGRESQGDRWEQFRGEQEALAQVIARLGNEGWEMVEQGSFPGLYEKPNVIFFKRLRQ